MPPSGACLGPQMGQTKLKKTVFYLVSTPPARWGQTKQPDLGPESLKLSNDPTNREEKTSRKTNPSTKRPREAEKGSKMKISRPKKIEK